MMEYSQCLVQGTVLGPWEVFVRTQLVLEENANIFAKESKSLERTQKI